MGIPRFFRYIQEQFPDVIDKVSYESGYLADIDNLYLDANGIIYNCVHQITQKKPRLCRRIPIPNTNPTSNLNTIPNLINDPTELFIEIGKYINDLYSFVKPKKLFYIALDGPAPLAKQSQQRQRRYRASLEKDLSSFDTACITPGTTFMNKLNKYLRYFIRLQISTNPNWKDIQVIFSSSQVPGEGEHKIVEYIRNQKDKLELIHCMYGLDADLFMLSLATHCPNFYLLREDQYVKSWTNTFFYKVNIGKLRQNIFNLWGAIGGNEEYLVDDFIFACFLAGNDFLHALPSCHNLVESIPYIMELRQTVLGNSYISNKGGAFNLNNVTILFMAMAKTESQTIFDQFYKNTFTNITLNNSLANPHKPNQGINLNEYKRNYYSKIGIDHTNQNQIWQFCKNYIQGLEWVHHYYHNWPSNWHWYFPYHYTPLLTDIVHCLTNASQGSRVSRVSNKYLPPILPLQQLLCVIPPKSKYLLPGYLQNLYKGPLKKYYPDTVEIDLEGKQNDWEGITLLPFINPDIVLDCYAQAVEKATKLGINVKHDRNVIEKTLRFYYNSCSKPYDYKSTYGSIKECKVSHCTL